jgi:NTE family protein
VTFKSIILISLLPLCLNARVFLNTSTANPDSLKSSAVSSYSAAKPLSEPVQSDPLQFFMGLEEPTQTSVPLQPQVREIDAVQIPPIVSDTDSYSHDIVLMLGGTGAHSLINIGVLKAVEYYKIPIDMVYGSGWSALIAALWAAGYSASEIEEFFNTTPQIFELMKSEDMPIVQDSIQGRLKKIGIPSIEWSLNILSTKDDMPKLVSTNSDQSLLPEVYVKLSSYLQSASVAAKHNSDSLFVRLRIGVSSMEKNEAIFLSQGNLPDLVMKSLPVYTESGIRKRELADVKHPDLYAHLPVDQFSKSFSPKTIVAVNTFPLRKGESSNLNEELKSQLFAFQWEQHAKNRDNVILLQPHQINSDSLNPPAIGFLIELGEAAFRQQIGRLGPQISGKRDYSADLDLRKQYREYTKDYRNDKLHLEEVAPEAQLHLSSLWVPTNNDSINHNQILQSLNNIHTSGLYRNTDLRITASSEAEGAYDYWLNAESINELKLALGGFGSWHTGPVAWAGATLRFVSQFEYTLEAEGFYGDFVKGGRGGIRISRIQGTGFFIGSAGNSLDFNYESLTQNPDRFILSGMSERKQREVKGYIGYVNPDQSEIRAEILWDRSSFTSNALKLYNQNPRNMDVEEIRISGLSIRLLHEKNDLKDDRFSSAGTHHLIAGGFYSNSILNDSRIVAPLVTRLEGRYQKNISQKQLRLGFGAEAGLDLLKVDSNSLVVPADLEISEGRGSDPDVNSFYKIRTSPTTESQWLPSPEFGSHAFLLLKTSIGIANSNNNGFFVFPSLFIDLEGEDIAQSYPSTFPVVEALVRWHIGAFDLQAGVLQSGVYAVDFEEFMDPEHLKWFARIGNFNF